jgi:putative ABC transport system permease protein
MIDYFRALVTRLRGLFGDRKADQELDDEIEAHLRLLTERYVRQGMTEDEAALAARGQFGNVTLLKEANHEMRGIRFIDTFFQDLRYGVRMLIRNPSFTLIAALTLALGIGANTAMFSVVNGVLLKPLPYPEPERLMRVFQSIMIMSSPKAPMSPADFRDFREQNTTCETIAGYFRQDLELAQGERAERLLGMRASSGYFRTLGFQPMLGREFTREEEIPDESAVVILSHGLWLRSFDGDPEIVGKTIRLSGKPFTVVGVAPAGLQHVGGGYRPLPHGESVDIWWPMRLGPNRPRGGQIVNVIGRLKPGVTRRQAEAEFDLIAARLAEQYPGPYRIEAKTLIQPLRDEIVEGSQRTLLLLLAAVFLVLLIACVNVANLALARAAAREREIAVRLALGAGRARILRQLLIESLTLAAIGGLLGLLLAKLAINALVKLGPEQLTRLQMISLDWRILVFTILISLLTGLLFGTAPALQSLKLNLNESLKEGGRATSGGKRQSRTRGALVVTEVALALALLLGAGLLMRSFLKLQQTDPGFNPKGVLTMSLVLPGARYAYGEPQISFLQRLLEPVSALPGVRSAGVTSDLPWTGYQNVASGFTIEGKTFPPDREPQAQYHFISADYMRTIGVPLLSGRWFNARDTRKSQPVILINQAMARKYWPGEDAVGKHITFLDSSFKDWTRIVGVIGDVKNYPSSAEAEPAYYYPVTQEPYPEISLAIRTDRDPLSLVESVRREVLTLDREMPISEVRTMETVAAAAVEGRRFMLLLVGVFAVTALALAGIGIYGVTSYLVANRTHEIGLRMALGADSFDVLKLALRQGMAWALAGVGVGLTLAFAATRLMANLLYGIGATDPATFVAVPLFLIGVSFVACWIPARRATKVDPLQAIRNE